MRSWIKRLKTKRDSPLKIAIASLMLGLMTAGYLLFFFGDWPFPLLFNLLGIMCSTGGSLLLAAGVYVSIHDEKRLLKQDDHGMLTELAIAASREIPWGVAFIVAGAIVHSLHALFSAFSPAYR